MHFMINFWSETTLFIKNMICIISYQKLHFFFKKYDLTNPISCFFIFSVVTGFFLFFHPRKFSSFKTLKKFRYCILVPQTMHFMINFWSETTLFIKNMICIISYQKLHFFFKKYDLTNPISCFFIFSVVTGFFLFFHPRKFTSFKTLEKFW